MCVCVRTLSCGQLFVTSWTVACQAPLSMDFPSKNTGVGCHFLLQGIFLIKAPKDRICIPCIDRWVLYHWATWEVHDMYVYICVYLFIPANTTWKTQQWPQDWKRSIFIPIPKKGNPKECANYRTIALISHTSKVMLNILQARLQLYVNHEFPDGQEGFRKGRGTRDQIANICWIIKKAREFQKKYLFLFYWLHQSLQLCGSQ